MLSSNVRLMQPNTPHRRQCKLFLCSDIYDVAIHLGRMSLLNLSFLFGQDFDPGQSVRCLSLGMIITVSVVLNN